MRYIGGKSLLISEIDKTIKETAPNAKSIIDLFSGSGIVANHFKNEGYVTVCNDMMYFSYVLLRGITQLNDVPIFNIPNIDDPIEHFNLLSLEDTDINIEDCFIYQNYSPHDNCNRMYFSTDNALKIDIVRITIENWKTKGYIDDDGYFYLLAALISSVPYVANIAGVFAAYLKKWDPRALKPLTIIKPDMNHNKQEIRAYNLKCLELLSIEKADVLYSDSPYNSREYLPNYHILETIARYDYPQIKGVTGIRDYSEQKSDFCSKTKVHLAFETMIRYANVRYIIISYNNEGLISTEDLSELCLKYSVNGTFHLKEIPYRRYKSKIPNTECGLCEQIYSFEKKENIYHKSPMNYIGGKYKLLPQIEPLFPHDIHNFIDLFCGGGDVCTNVMADKIYANDINNFVVEIFKEFQKYDIDVLLSAIYNIIDKYSLTKTNDAGYLSLRNDYNASEYKNPIELFVLVCYSFNHQFRFNSKYEYNNPFGKNRSSFNDAIKNNLIEFHNSIKKIEFSSINFKEYNLSAFGKYDFIYADPPYLITTGSYNDGKRGFEGWTKDDDLRLFQLLDTANEKGIRFALSNVFEHKGQKNDELIDWAKKYNIHYLNYDYRNSNYHSKNTTENTIEVLITNY